MSLNLSFMELYHFVSSLLQTLLRFDGLLAIILIYYIMKYVLSLIALGSQKIIKAPVKNLQLSVKDLKLRVFYDLIYMYASKSLKPFDYFGCYNLAIFTRDFMNIPYIFGMISEF